MNLDCRSDKNVAMKATLSLNEIWFLYVQQLITLPGKANQTIANFSFNFHPNLAKILVNLH
jgi:hypothetical protein